MVHITEREIIKHLRLLSLIQLSEVFQNFFVNVLIHLYNKHLPIGDELILHEFLPIVWIPTER